MSTMSRWSKGSSQGGAPDADLTSVSTVTTGIELVSFDDHPKK